MSLINEALKKAQRQRTALTPDPAAAGGETAPQPIAKRPSPLRANSVLLAFVGAAVLVVLSVLITVLLVNRPAPTLAAATPELGAPPTIDLNAPSPVIVAPALTPPPGSAPEPSSSTLPTRTTPVTVSAIASPVVTATEAAAVSVVSSESGSSAAIIGAEPSAAADAPPEIPIPVVEVDPDPRVANFVDSVRVTGIRSSGNESKVLMNDRVYRVNDIVERTLGVRLIKVAPEALTFQDTNGAIYTKFF